LAGTVFKLATWTLENTDAGPVLTIQGSKRHRQQISQSAQSSGCLALTLPFLWPNAALYFHSEPKMGNKIFTEADRKFTPPLPALPGVTLPTAGRGQRVSLERGVATRSKKNPGKRSKKGG
jgi:hypothetical protein